MCRVCTSGRDNHEDEHGAVQHDYVSAHSHRDEGSNCGLGIGERILKELMTHKSASN